LKSLEIWLEELGAQRSNTDPCCWDWIMPEWSAEINMETENLRITWKKDDIKYQCTFPYGLSREDVQSAFYQGP
tara:strand:+ start:2233 stop:2454 length:222 start_codon:yes stop_codon:yes gene_type:complete